MIAIFSDMVERNLEVFMYYLSVFGYSFDDFDRIVLAYVSMSFLS